MIITRRIELPLLLKYFGLPMIAVEVGVNGGHNSTDLLKNGIEYIYCVDAWKELDQVGDGGFPQKWHDECYEECINNLKPFIGKYTILRGLSSEMCHQIQDNSLGLVYIDSDHSYEGVKADIENYLPKLVKNALISFHDYYNSGYSGSKAIDEFANEKNLTIFTLEEDGEPNNMSIWMQI